MTTDRIERMDNVEVAGLVLALVGGILALLPELETLLRFTAGWQEPLILALMAGVALIGVLWASRGRTAVGGLTAGIAGLVLAVLGPTAPGLIAMVGGVLLFAAAQDQGPVVYDQEEQPAGSGSGDTI